MAGAVLHGVAGAQVRDTTKKRDTTLALPARSGPDSLLRDSLAKRDTVKKVPRDTIKAPFARSELPLTLEIGRRLRWNRDSVLATGAITLADLL